MSCEQKTGHADLSIAAVKRCQSAERVLREIARLAELKSYKDQPCGSESML